MAPRTGRPTDSRKNLRLQIRVDEQTLAELDECVKRDNSTRSDVVRKGIKLVKGEQEKQRTGALVKATVL